MRSMSEFVRAVPEGRQRPRLNKSSATPPPTTLALYCSLPFRAFSAFLALFFPASRHQNLGSSIFPAPILASVMKSVDFTKLVSIIVIIVVRRADMEQIQQYVSVTQAKARLLDLVRRLQDTGDTIAITKNGVPEAVLVSMEKFQGLLETLDILSDEKTMKSLRKSMREAEKRKWISEDEVSWE